MNTEAIPVASTNALRVDRSFSFPPQPRLGGIYRDANDRSFIVLRVGPEGIFVEYADGTTRSINVNVWPYIVTRAAVC